MKGKEGEKSVIGSDSGGPKKKWKEDETMARQLVLEGNEERLISFGTNFPRSPTGTCHIGSEFT